MWTESCSTFWPVSLSDPVVTRSVEFPPARHRREVL